MLEPLNMIIVTLSCFVFIGIALYLVNKYGLTMLGVVAIPTYAVLTINFIVLWVTNTIAIVPYIVTVCVILCWDFAIGLYVIKFKNMKLIISYVVMFALILIGGIL